MQNGTVTTRQTNAELIQNANLVYNQIFWGTLLREFRETSEPTVLDGGRGGAIFTRQLDQEIIRRMSLRGETTPLAKWLTDKNRLRNSELVPLRAIESAGARPAVALHG